MAHGDRVEPHKGAAIRIQEITFYFYPTYGIRPVQNHYFHSSLPTSLKEEG
jgi:hypothetical protein